MAKNRVVSTTCDNALDLVRVTMSLSVWVLRVFKNLGSLIYDALVIMLWKSSKDVSLNGYQKSVIIALYDDLMVINYLSANFILRIEIV